VARLLCAILDWSSRMMQQRGDPHLEAVAEFFNQSAISQFDLEDLPREGMHYRDNHDRCEDGLAPSPQQVWEIRRILTLEPPQAQTRLPTRW
jgi:hypothetical protein